MRETIGILRSLNETVPNPLPLPTLADVSRVENELGLQLPPEFVALQLAAGDVTYGTYEPVTLTIGSGHTYITTVATDAWAAGVPRALLPICEDNGDYFCIDQNSRIIYWSHDGTSSESWPTLEDWVKSVWLA